MSGWRPERPILMTADPIGGVWTYALDLCRHLEGCTIALASMGRSLTRAERAEVGKLAHVELFESGFKLEWMSDSRREVSAAGDWLRGVAARVRPSLVHLNQFSHGAMAWDVPCLVVGHSCVYSWYEAVKRRLPGNEWQDYRRMVYCGLRGADRVTAPSRWMLLSLQRTYGSFRAAEPIYNGRSRELFIRRSKAGLILTAGRLWDEAKNTAALDAIAPEISWPIYAAGAIAAPDGGRGAFGNLRLLGSVDAATLASHMSRAAIFVLPARYEPFGVTVLEAALSACALVLGDIPSLREIWQDAALFVPPDEPHKMTEALSSLIADTELRQRLARRARRRALAFSPERMARAYLALYREMIGQSAPQKRPQCSRDAESQPRP